MALKKSPLKKTSSQKKAIAKRAAWKHFRLFILDRDDWTCITCGAKLVKGSRRSHAGHYVHGVTLTKLYMDEHNVAAQCAGCNTFLHGNLPRYTIYLEDKYGREEVERLLSLKGSDELSGDKPNEEWYRNIAEKYKALNEEKN